MRTLQRSEAVGPSLRCRSYPEIQRYREWLRNDRLFQLHQFSMDEGLDFVELLNDFPNQKRLREKKDSVPAMVPFQLGKLRRIWREHRRERPWYEAAHGAGATVGKLLGAGGGGFLLFYAPQERHEQIKAALPQLRRISMDFEPLGSRIIFYH